MALVSSVLPSPFAPKSLTWYVLACFGATLAAWLWFGASAATTGVAASACSKDRRCIDIQISGLRQRAEAFGTNDPAFFGKAGRGTRGTVPSSSHHSYG